MIYRIGMQSFYTEQDVPRTTRRSNAQMIIYNDEKETGYNGDSRIRKQKKEE